MSEFIDIKNRISNIPLLVYPWYWILDESIFNWIKVQTNNFANITDKGNLSEEMINNFKQIDNPEFIKKIIVAYNVTSRKEYPAFGFKKISVSVIESNIINLALLDDDFISKVLDIKFNINVLNEEIDSTKEYMKMTFDSTISPDNYQIISEQIKKNNIFIAQRAILIVDKINLVI